MNRNVTLKLVAAPSPLDEMAAAKVAVKAGGSNEAQSAARIVPLTVDQIEQGDYVTYGPSRVMVINRIEKDMVVLEDPFHPSGKYPIEVKHSEFGSNVMRTSREHVKSEYTRMRLPVPEHVDEMRINDVDTQTDNMTWEEI